MGTQTDPGPLVCWWCGYELDGVDLIRSDLKCPECGRDNVPGNGPEAPHVRRRWPRWWVLGMEFLWPGMVLGITLPLGMAHPPPAWLATAQYEVAWAGFPAAAMCIVWAPMMATVVVEERVPGCFKRRVMLGVAIGGIVANLAVAVGEAAIARLVGLRF